MKRLIFSSLQSWKHDTDRKPLILRGARQTGKTWSITDFGQRSFKGAFHKIDFEKQPDWHKVFDKNLDPVRILSELELLLNAPIVPGKDLLFFDEIQNCPAALRALRYFYEEIPDLHVIAAGSLLEFALSDIAFPVGRVRMMDMHPLTFTEFLEATNQSRLSRLLDEPLHHPGEAVHSRLLDELRSYFFIGGMPECVACYAKTGSVRNTFEIKAALIDTFREDFAKYTPSVNKQCLNTVLASVSKSVGKQLKYSRLAEDYSVPTIKKAFNLLEQARLIKSVHSVNPPQIPFGAAVSQKIFKAVMLDIGLMQQLCALPLNIDVQQKDLLSIYEGAMAEQFAGQALCAAGQPLYYWSRQAKSSSAEVDFLISIQGQVIPVEVKSGPAGKLRSMHQFLAEAPHSPGGIVLSTAPYSPLPGQKLTFVPLYFAEKINRAFL